MMTLGHNSSVIFYDCETSPIGYEEERLSNKKSDSSYPLLAFERVLSHLSYDQIVGSNLFISHWFDNFDLSKAPDKYLNHKHFVDMVEKYNLTVIPLSPNFTHHDAHAWSSLAFAENFNATIKGPLHTIVVDGFGNNQEVVSIYEYPENDTNTIGPVLLKRVYGYKNSLGLLYQYATSFCGMKENQDEYKFLGYEVQISNIMPQIDIEDIRLRAYKFSMQWMRDCLFGNTQRLDVDCQFNDSNDIINFASLGNAKKWFFDHFAQFTIDICRPYTDISNEHLRIIIGYYVQQCIEQCLLRIISKYNIKNVFLSGGCFLNVKLNKVILDAIPGNISVNPLSGDQGAAIGLFRKYTNTKFNFTDLCWGKRDKLKISAGHTMDLANENIFIVNTDMAFVYQVTKCLELNMIVNVIQGNMEFGPRALCNTTTLALPRLENTMYINKVNKRNEVMPMAPVMLKDVSKAFMDNKKLNRVIGSNKFMIITHDTTEEAAMYRGVLHNKLEGGFTCRPQIVDHTNGNIFQILKNMPAGLGGLCLINTSFNTHGRPILFSVEDAIEDFRKQRKGDFAERLMLVILSKND